MKRLLMILIVIIVFNINNVYAYSIDTEEELDSISNELIMKQLEEIDMESMEETVNHINDELSDYMPKINMKEIIISLIKGEEIFSLKDILNGILKYIFKEISANSALLVKLVILSVICALLNNLSSAFESDAVGKIANTACYLVVIAIAIKSFSIAIMIGKDAIDSMVSFVQALLPVLLTLLMSMGGITTAAMFQPIMIAIVGMTSTVMKDMIMPLVFFSAILSIVNHLSSKIQVSKLSSLLKQGTMVLMGLILTVFTGVITIHGTIASTADGVTIRTAKFAVDSFIPVVGGYVTEAFDTIMGCSLLLKNSIGALGLIVIAIVVTIPILKILSLIFIYKFTTALIEPFTEDQLISCLNDMSNAMVLILVIVLLVAIMFFIMLTIIVGASNITLMMR